MKILTDGDIEAFFRSPSSTTDATVRAETRLTIGRWELRSAAGGRRCRAALEVYEHGELLDVLVASSLGRALPCGARRATGDAGRESVAWGRIPASGVLPRVTFLGHGLRRRHCPAPAVSVAGSFWFAHVAGSFPRVLVEAVDGPSVLLRCGRAS
ncbi:hypothetical protein [Kitasatospora camelliae]|uniref:Uncharacterized protein n=1 Tax=Kitasatospora camelliae TaxID=3156397 RepID=A0AAU8JWK5_9ACTN